MNRAWIGIGGNVGDVPAQLHRALLRLAREVRVLRVSPWFETEPVGYVDQPWFLNGVIEVATDRSPRDLMALLLRIEQELGRERRERWGPRTVDLDLLLYGGETAGTGAGRAAEWVTLDESNLVLPHPRMLERGFVLRPLYDVAPELVLPGGLALRGAVAALPPEPVVRRWRPGLAGRQWLFDAAPHRSRARGCGEHIWHFGYRTYIMGILNVTPDSFSDGGRYSAVAAAVRQALRMLEDGADIIDIGGESTRPGHTPVTAEEELRRVIPVVEALRQESGCLISIDTSKAVVARQALAAGADWVNDVRGLGGDPEMAAVVAAAGVPAVLMHWQHVAAGPDLMLAIADGLHDAVQRAQEAGVLRQRLIVDPGVGFGKDLAGNLQIIRELPALEALGLPVLLGSSRKSLIGKVLDLPVDQRMEGTAATVALGIAGGAHIVRVHDVREMARVARMTDALVRSPICRPVS